MKGCITRAMIATYEDVRNEHKERLELVFNKFGPLQYWEELHFLQEQVMERYGYYDENR